jgi:transcriptional regulator with XRE-family HTH domain
VRLPLIAGLDDRFAASLHNLRRAKRVSRPELAARTGMSASAIERIETGNGTTGRRRVSIGEAVALAEALGATPGDLLRGIDPPADVCGKGHPRTAANTHVWRGRRRCRPCNLDAKRRSLARKASQSGVPIQPATT